ncbi:ABC transporter permease [Staphylospora marina]|uniref:ABC transporter permease n=1 Tax=Staphylospora marina TaxID=2490858 RepID=UPI000F5C20BE|nr:ABC transporter permease [Staphylospora marina]
MNLRSLALKNVRFHAQSYLAYFLSCSFSVWMFFLYTSLLFHPVLKEKTIPSQFVALLYLVEAIVAVFSVLFIGYSLSAFLRNRKRDIGLMQVLGMSVNQVTRMIAWENLWVGSAATVFGIGLGIVFFKLFLLGVSAVLGFDTPIPHVLSVRAVLLTGIGFGILFVFLSWRNRIMISKLSIADLFREAVQEKKKPTFSVWLVILSLVCIGGAYRLALTITAGKLLQGLVPILTLVLIGTYLGFTQVSVAAIHLCEKATSFYYRGKNLLLISQLRYRLRDNARILFIVSILSSMVLTSVSVCFTYYLQAERAAEDQAPYHVSWHESPNSRLDGMVEKWIHNENLTVTAEVEFPVIRAESRVHDFSPTTYHVISNANLNQLLQSSTGLPPIQLQPGQVAFVKSGGAWKESIKQLSPESTITYQVGTQTYPAKLTKQIEGVLFNESDITRFMLVVDDDTFQRLANTAPSTDQVIVHGYRFTDWKQVEPLIKELQQQIGNEYAVNGTYPVYDLLKKIFAPLMFVSLFIGLLFFLASGSILYFKLFTELPVDRRQMRVLDKLGIRKKEAGSILGWQIRLLFFIPFVVGICHSAVALKMFSFFFQTPVWGTFGAVAGIYLGVLLLYYGWTNRGYTQTVLNQ